MFGFHHVSFHQVGLLLCLVSASLGPSWGCFNQVKYKSRHQICWGSVSFPLCHRSKDLKWQTSVTDQLQLSFIWRAKDSIPWRHNLSWFPLFICFVSSPLSLPYANWASQEGGVFVPPKVFTLVCGFSFVLFSQAFPFLCFLATAILDSFPLF